MRELFFIMANGEVVIAEDRSFLESVTAVGVVFHKSSGGARSSHIRPPSETFLDHSHYVWQLIPVLYISMSAAGVETKIKQYQPQTTATA